MERGAIGAAGAAILALSIICQVLELSGMDTEDRIRVLETAAKMQKARSE